MTGRSLAFICILALGVAPAVVIASQFAEVPGGHALGLGGAAAKAISAAAPAIVSDAALAGVSTPVALAAALAFLAPSKDKKTLFNASIAICLVGWASYLWMDAVLSQDVARDALIAVLDQGEAAKTQTAVAHVANFAVAGRIAYLALAAGPARDQAAGRRRRDRRRRRPSARRVRRGAGGNAEDFRGLIGVRVVGTREDPFADPVWLAASDGVYAFAYDRSLFTSGAYVERIVVIGWRPKAIDVPASNVDAFSVEVPLVLRKWRADETRSVEANPFTGVGEARCAPMSGCASRCGAGRGSSPRFSKRRTTPLWSRPKRR
ncbi:hypothetical protein [Chenggangzhangella methanolivorans]|uniref:Uncharacterized protein n=1 Tax=Chenggangzhangella methanolivorans TaxID=1437009 RepID=A0A9E6ULU3_9HYPH|nr:hypothetical protein [Chenggangzhangella methanolivorans]QZN99355.1 hypothetical protein K6K41_21660 [Chenggangzhangella methanolivorans]